MKYEELEEQNKRLLQQLNTMADLESLRAGECESKQALIDELSTALKTVDRWFERRNICTAIGMQIDIKRVLELAEGRE